MTDSFTQKLRSISGGTRMADVSELVARLRAEAALSTKQKPEFVDPADEPLETPEKVKETPEAELTVEELKSELRQLQEEYDIKSILLDLFQTEADSMLPVMEQILETSIRDEKTASDALLNYDRLWFSRVLLSENGKVSIAATIYTVASRYTKSNLETVKAIMDRNPVLMEHILLPQVD